MSEIRFVTDEHVSPAVTLGLRRRGVDIQTIVEANRLGASDDDLLEFALTENRVVFTQDQDFLAIAAAGRQHAGIVYAKQGSAIGDVIRGLALIAEVLTAEEMMNQVEFL